MSNKELQQQITDLQDRLNRELRRLSGLRQKGKYLEMQYEDAREREANSDNLVMALLERQKELNVLLDRANAMVGRNQEALCATSLQFGEMAKALPESQRAQWAERAARLRELFGGAGIPNENLFSFDTTSLGEPSGRTCPRCGRHTNRGTAACPFCYAPMDSSAAPAARRRIALPLLRSSRRHSPDSRNPAH